MDYIDFGAYHTNNRHCFCGMVTARPQANDRSLQFTDWFFVGKKNCLYDNDYKANFYKKSIKTNIRLCIAFRQKGDAVYKWQFELSLHGLFQFF